MGGCAMASDDRLGMTGPDGRYHGVRNLSVHDGSLFPTSIGANPQLSIYAVSARLASALAQALA
jgi:choline dehydrogenase-like flavoprotein